MLDENRNYAVLLGLNAQAGTAGLSGVNSEQREELSQTDDTSAYHEQPGIGIGAHTRATDIRLKWISSTSTRV